MKGNYVIWDTKTGINDGAYVSLEDAMDRYKKMSEETKQKMRLAKIGKKRGPYNKNKNGD